MLSDTKTIRPAKGQKWFGFWTLAGRSVLFLHHFLYGSFELGIMAIDEIFRTVVNLDVWVQLGILAKHTTHVAAAYLRNTEYQRVVHQRFPPYGCHGSCYRSTDQLADSEFLVNPWETMTVAVIVLADHDAGWLHPFVERIAANYLSVRHKLLILLAVEQGA